MKISICRAIWGLGFFWMFFYCDQPTQKIPFIPPPRFVAASSDTALIEEGIDAIPDADAIFLQWQRAELYSGFQLYRRCQDSVNYILVKTLNGNDSSCIDVVGLEKHYYYYLKASAEDGYWSEPSDTVDYYLLNKANGLRVNNTNFVEFNWQVKGISPAQYILRLEDAETNHNIWLSIIPSAYQGPYEKAIFNWDGKAKVMQLTSGRLYRWRVDCRGTMPNSGSESNWDHFIML